MAFALSEAQADRDRRVFTGEEATAIHFPIVTTNERDFRLATEQEHAVYAGRDVVAFLDTVQPYRDFTRRRTPWRNWMS